MLHKNDTSLDLSNDFSLHNLPFGVFSTEMDSKRRIGVVLGDRVFDLNRLNDWGVFPEHRDRLERALAQPVLNDFIALGRTVTNGVRARLRELLTDRPDRYDGLPDFVTPRAAARMHLPVRVGDYTDFYSSLDHATNVGKLFRDPENALLPNWRHLPVAYHGRSSSIGASGTPVRRPSGQLLRPGADAPVYAPTERLDFELEVAFIVGKDSELGVPIPVDRAEEYIFGLVLFNDWSARDVQRWEYVPLGPFLGKNFASSMSPWIVPLDALDAFRTAGPEQTPEPLPYLRGAGQRHLDVQLSVGITPAGSDVETVVCRTNLRHLYWNMAQQLAHHTSNGCNVRVGDVLASGTISGPTPDSAGSLLELSENGTRPLRLDDGNVRTFLRDGDRVTLRGFGARDGIRVGFGEVTNTILPTVP